MRAVKLVTVPLVTAKSLASRPVTAAVESTVYFKVPSVLALPKAKVRTGLAKPAGMAALKAPAKLSSLLADLKVPAATDTLTVDTLSFGVKVAV